MRRLSRFAVIERGVEVVVERSRFGIGTGRQVETMVKVCGWYDNEMGYSTRLVDLSIIVGTRR